VINCFKYLAKNLCQTWKSLGDEATEEEGDENDGVPDQQGHLHVGVQGANKHPKALELKNNNTDLEKTKRSALVALSDCLCRHI